MIIMITGASHTGKTHLAQRIMEEKHITYMCQDHIKMGLIRSHNTNLTPCDTIEQLTNYLWPITREIIKTAIENNQNLIIEGCYVPFDWKKDFEEEYLSKIKWICLCMSDNYIENHFEDVKQYANCIEKRLEDDCTKELMKSENQFFHKGCEAYALDYVFIEDDYEKTIVQLLGRLSYM